MSYELGYAVFGLMFVVGTVGFWVVTRALRDPAVIYLPEPAAAAPARR